MQRHDTVQCLLAGRALRERLMMEAGGPRIHAKSAGEAAVHRASPIFCISLVLYFCICIALYIVYIPREPGQL